MTEENAGRSSKGFTPETLDRQLLVTPLLDAIARDGEAAPQSIIIDVNLEHPDFEAEEEGGETAKDVLCAWVEAAEPGAVRKQKTKFVTQYVFARMSGANVKKLAQVIELEAQSHRLVRKRIVRVAHRIWPDEKLKSFTNKSASVVKADAARASFGALGADIVWAVADTGVDADHPHFATHKTLELTRPLRHRDFLSDEEDVSVLEALATRDDDGHGTHVAGIIAGEFVTESTGASVLGAPGRRIVAHARRRFGPKDVRSEIVRDLKRMSGIAPMTKIMSLRVLSATEGECSNLIAAIAYIQKLNRHGQRIIVHGLNISAGYDFQPEWFACGRSPLCVEVDRLVRSGVVVVVAAGNSGYIGVDQGAERGAGVDLTINDPGNAALAITVGSTHRDSPHAYGVSYFSSKGPTGDGRLKPDLVAPGEKILSCRSSDKPTAESETFEDEDAFEEHPTIAEPPPAGEVVARYTEWSGTSMAAPHVSGAAAAFLSVRREWIGKPEAVKRLLMRTAVDLGRDRNFQGRGVVDVMAALQDRQAQEETLP